MSAEYESLLKYKTKVGKYEEIKDNQPSPQGRQRVYFTCHPDDFDKYFDEVTNEILLKQPNCAIYFYDGEVPADEEDRDLDLNQMILFVIPVTYKFICDDECQARKDFKYAKENTISMLLLQQEPGLEELFNQKCGNYQMFSKFMSMQNSQFYDPTAITYDEKLTKYLKSKILGDELIKEIQQAFDAYIFLSYRKKDRKYAQELMKLIHSNDFCRDIAIWYDEFLVSGEDFNEAIKEAMEKSKLFSMVVTPNLINEANYVQSTEYPAAKEAGKPVFPAESVPTDAEKLKELYPDIPDTVDANGAEFSKELLNTIRKIAIKENDKDPKHNYLIGLAYLNGIDVEKNEEKGIELITSAAEAGLFEAIKKLYEISRDYYYDFSFSESENIAKKTIRILNNLYDNYVNMEDKEIELKLSIVSLLSNIFYSSYNSQESEKLLLEQLETIGHMDNIQSVTVLCFIEEYYLSLADIYIFEHKYDKAKNNLKKALNNLYKFNNDYYLNMVKEKLANLFENINEYEKAENLYLELSNLYEKKDEIAKFTIINHNLAELYFLQNKYDKAENIMVRTLKIFSDYIEEKHSTVDEIELVYIKDMLASIYAETERYEDAEILFFENLKILKNGFQKKQMVYAWDLLKTYDHLGRLFFLTKKYAESIKYHNESKKIIEDYLASTSDAYYYYYYLALVYNNLASCYLCINDCDDSEKNYNEALKLFLKGAQYNPSENYPRIAMIYSNLKTLYLKKHRYIKAFRYYFKAVSIAEQYPEDLMCKQILKVK